MPCLVPTVNGYKRLVESYWAPVNVSYAYENRVASVRIISPPLADRAATRLEVRVPGADVSFLAPLSLPLTPDDLRSSLSVLLTSIALQMNPYLTFSAVIACGLYGIKNKLPLTQPPLRTKGDNLPKLQRLPKTLQEATARMGHEASLARKVLGDEFVDHYCGTRVRHVLLDLKIIRSELTYHDSIGRSTSGSSSLLP